MGQPVDQCGIGMRAPPWPTARACIYGGIETSALGYNRCPRPIPTPNPIRRWVNTIFPLSFLVVRSAFKILGHTPIDFGTYPNTRSPTLPLPLTLDHTSVWPSLPQPLPQLALIKKVMIDYDTNSSNIDWYYPIGHEWGREWDEKKSSQKWKGRIGQ